MGIERRIGRVMQRELKRLAGQKGLNFGPVELHWREPVAAPSAGFDPNLQGSGGPPAYLDKVSNPHPNALIHTVNIHTTGFVKHAEVKAGDLILDFVGDVAIDGKSHLRFVIGGISYVQKGAGGELAESWDVRCGGIPITRTVLVTRGV